MGFLDMKHEFRDGFIEELQAYAQQLQAFNVLLISNFMMDIGIEETKRIVSDIISPLFNDAEKAILYNDGDNEYFAPVLNKIAKRSRNRYELVLDQELFTDKLMGFWSSEDRKRGSVLWQNDLSNIDMLKFLKSVKDPFVLGNMGAILPRGAISHAKKLTKENANKIVFCLSSADGLKALVIFMSPGIIAEYVMVAIENCMLSESFLIRYGTRDYQEQE